MRKFLICILLFTISIGALGGCKKSEVEQNTEKLFEKSDSNELSYGEFGFGVISQTEEKQQYEYNGEEVKIPYYVEGMDKESASNFGILVFVDGVAQPYSIETKEGEKGKEQYMQKFSLKEGERQEFNLVFNPVSGEEGEKVGFITATILEPDYLPESVENPNFGIYYSLSAIVPQEIVINKKVENSLVPYTDVEKVDIPQEILDALKKISTGDSYDILDESVFLELMSTTDKETNIINAKAGKAKVKIRLYGGLEVKDRITLFINNEPVKVEGADFVEIKTEKGKMCTIEVEIDTQSAEKMNSLYATVMTTDSDYFEQDIIESNTMLLVNE